MVRFDTVCYPAGIESFEVGTCMPVKKRQIGKPKGRYGRSRGAVRAEAQVAL